MRLGVEPGDRVAIYMPMCPDVAVASHACAHVGAVQVPIFSGFAAPAVRAAPARLGGEGRAHGRPLPSPRQAARHARDGRRRRRNAAPSVEHVVTWSRDEGWGEIVEAGPGELPPLEVDSEHPYLLAYTSGTTGKPKGAVHVQGGFLVSITREVAYQADARPDDVVHFATDMGWIMGPWTVVGGGALGCTLVFAEGAPDQPAGPSLEPDRARARRRARDFADAGSRADPARRAAGDLSSLRTIVTTGEPWNPDPYRWLFEQVGGGRCPIINCSGGTEVAACFLSPTPAIPNQGVLPRRAGARDGDGRASTARGARWSGPARSASSSAASRSRG